MASLVEIANMALGEVGEQSLTTIDDDSTPGRLCRQHIYQAVREVMARGKWKCARGQAEPGQLSDIPAFGWDYAYELPTDYIRMAAFNEVDSSELWADMFEVQGRNLLTDETTVSLVYIKDLSMAPNDIGLLTPLVVKACYLNLAAKLAWPLQQSRTLKDKLEEDYRVALKEAKSTDALEEYRPVTDPASGSRWIATRATTG